MIQNSNSTILPDTPGKDPTTDDLLFYAPFAEHLANSIERMFNPNGFVIAINGEWGSGKTTILNFIQYFLNKKSEEVRPVIIEFNPWWFSGRDDLTRQLFVQFGIEVSKNLKNAQEVTELIGEYLLAFSSMALPGAIHKPIETGYKKSGNVIKRLFGLEKIDPSKRSVSEIKKEIIEKISSKGKILVIIDDIERLNSDEIRQIFQVIKTVAEFPNVVFLLSFDKKIVANILQDIQNLPGEEYLEKIIQTQFDIPHPEKELLTEVLSKKLKKMFPDKDFDRQDWLDLFSNGISQLIDTPRDIHRFINTISVTYPAVANEVNLTDFITLETLRIFQPETYDKIRNYPVAFLGYRGSYENEEQFDKIFFDDLLSLSKNKSFAIDYILKYLFPKYSHRHEKNYFSNWRMMRRDLRLCSPEIFPTYFWMTIPPYQLTKKEIQEIIDLTSDTEKFKFRFIEMMKAEESSVILRINHIFSRLTDHSEEIPNDNIISLLPRLYEISDEIFLQQDRLSPNDFIGNNFQEGDFIRDLLLSRLTEPERYMVLKQIIQNSKTFFSITFDIRKIFEKDGNTTWTLASPQNEQMISLEHLADLKEPLVLNYENFSQSNKLLKSPNIRYI